MVASFSMIVSADNIPVKDAWFIHYDGDVLVLCENGNLYIGESISDDTPTLLLNGIIDVIIERDVYGNVEHCAALDEKGNISLIEINDYKKTKVYRTIDVNASKLLYTDSNNCIFINDYNELIYYECEYMYGNYYDYFFEITDDAETAIKGLWCDMYVIKTNGDLYKLALDRPAAEPIDTVESEDYILSNVSNIANFKYSGRGAGTEFIYMILKNNGDLYLVDSEKNEPIERIGKNIPTLDNVKVKVHYYSGQNHYCEVEYVDLYGGFYIYNSANKQITNYYSDAKALYHFENSRAKLERYIVSTDNKAYYCGYVGSTPLSERQELATNVEGLFTGTKDIVAYSGNGKNIRLLDENEIYLTDVKTVIENECLNKLSNYMFIKTNGELWATQSMYGGEPFLTKFSEKPTKLYIYGFETYLVSEIQIKNDRSMYPFRECLEELGATVLWDSVNRCAIGEHNGITVEFPIDKNYYYINGEIHYMDTTSYISNGRTYIPIRFAAEALGFTVEWESTSVENKISIFE